MSSDFHEDLDIEERELHPIQPNTWLRLARLVIQHWKFVLLGAFAILIGTFAALAEPRLFGYAIDEAIVPRKLDLLVRLSGIFLCVITVRMIASISQGYLFEWLGQRVTQELRCMLFSHLHRLQTRDLDRNPAGRLLTRVTNDVASLVEMFSAGMVTMFSNALMVIGILGWLFILDSRLGWIASSVFPILVALSVYFSVKLKVSYRDARSRLSSLNAFFAENLLGMKVIQLFNRKSLHLSRFERLNQWYSDAQIGTIRIFAFFQPSITLAAGVSVALVIWFGGNAARAGDIKVGVLFAYFSYVLSLFQPMRELADKWNVFLSGMASAERIFAILDWPVEQAQQDVELPAQSLTGVKGHIVFENIWFAYDDKHWVLRDFSLEILPGERIGVVGHTGAGKSTLMSLLMRFYEPQKGRILIDGQDIRLYDRRALRASIGIVQQDVFIFSGSYQDNITFWANTPFKSSFANSELILQEKGSNLSMGERQVLAFARVQAAQPQIWILDEATANLDSETELTVQNALETASVGKTTILIAHRLATVRNANRILVLHKGSVVEQGSHQELLAINGLYSRLYRLQESEEELVSAPSFTVPDTGAKWNRSIQRV